jgi:hypothetical protein
MMSWLVLKSAHEWLVLKRPVTPRCSASRLRSFDHSILKGMWASLSLEGLYGLACCLDGPVHLGIFIGETGVIGLSWTTDGLAVRILGTATRKDENDTEGSKERPFHCSSLDFGFGHPLQGL